MHVHTGESQVMVIMLYRGYPTGEIALMMVIDIAEGGYAVAPTSLFQPGSFEMLPYQVAHGFRSIGVAARAYKLIKLSGKLVIQRYSEAFHCLSGKKT